MLKQYYINNKNLLVASFINRSLLSYAQVWEPTGDKIKTQWVEKVDPANPLML